MLCFGNACSDVSAIFIFVTDFGVRLQRQFFLLQVLSGSEVAGWVFEKTPFGDPGALQAVFRYERILKSFAAIESLSARTEVGCTPQ